MAFRESFIALYIYVAGSAGAALFFVERSGAAGCEKSLLLLCIAWAPMMCYPILSRIAPHSYWPAGVVACTVGLLSSGAFLAFVSFVFLHSVALPVASPLTSSILGLGATAAVVSLIFSLTALSPAWRGRVRHRLSLEENGPIQHFVYSLFYLDMGSFFPMLFASFAVLAWSAFLKWRWDVMLDFEVIPVTGALVGSFLLSATRLYRQTLMALPPLPWVKRLPQSPWWISILCLLSTLYLSACAVRLFPVRTAAGILVAVEAITLLCVASPSALVRRVVLATMLVLLIIVRS